MTRLRVKCRPLFTRWRTLLALLLVLTNLALPAHYNATANTDPDNDNPPVAVPESGAPQPAGAANHTIFLPFVTGGESTVTTENGAETGPADVPGGIDAQLAQAGHTTFWVILQEQADLTAAARVAPNWEARGRFVFDRLVAVANRTQSRLRALLQQRNADFTPYWLVNTIRVSGDQALRAEIAALPEVAAILPDQLYQIPQPTPGVEQFSVSAVEWNVDRINAPQVWSTFGVRGEGIVVANIDSGVQYDHPALVQQYRGSLGGGAFDHNYNWFDPANVCGSPSLAPCDNNGHGTHTMGTMVGEEAGGANQIGVAPGVRWIVAKGCETNSCSTATLLAAGQWVLAPTDLSGQNPRPDLRPHIVNNSWGGVGGDIFYQATVNAWIAAGIFPAFSNGNNGPSCSTAGSPGDNVQSYSSGAFDINNAIAGFSSRGASLFGGEIKPNLAAPGVNVRSSLLNNAYGALSGTSMASPHTAATVALMWSAAPALVGDVTQTRALLDQTAIDVADLSCGGTTTDNNVWGEGRLDAFAAVNQSPRGATGTLAGVVTDTSTGAAIAGATVTVAGPMTRTVTTDANGQYSLLALVGSYVVTARAFGYFEQSVGGVVVNQDQTTSQNFALARMPSGSLQGAVTDGANGTPIVGAMVDAVSSTGMLTVLADGNGQYNFSNLPVGSYTVTARASGYFEQSAGGVVINENQTSVQNFALSPTGQWTPTDSMTATRSNPTASLLADGRMLVTGGNFNNPPEIYDPATRTWTTTSNLTEARNNHTATRLNDGRVLVAGGHLTGLDPVNPFLRISSAEIFDPASGVWSLTGSMGGARSNHTATRLNDGRVLVAGGFCCTPSDGSELSSAEIYDPATGVWSPTGSMTAVRSSHIAVLLADGRVLVTGGSASAPSSTEIYDPATGVWSPTGNRTTTAFGRAWLLNDGRVLLINAANAEIYDPATGVWSATGGMSPTVRGSGWSATMLDNGLVLVAGGLGGFDNFGTPLNLTSAELFDPATGQWIPTHNMSTGRREHLATLLADGQVLVAGGVIGTGAPINSAELFDLPPDLLQGRVTDATTGAPVADATIQVNGSFTITALTDANGFYTLLLRPGMYAVTVRVLGYFEQTAGAVVINQNQTTILNFALTPASLQSVSGHVRDAVGTPVANATVTILDTPLPPATTDANGFYTIAGVSEGTYTVRAERAGRCLAPQEQPLTVVSGPATLDFALAQLSDSFGYTCQLVMPAYIEATNVLPGGIPEVALPFPFPFYGQSHTTAWVATNGLLNFLQAHAGLGLNTTIPNTALPNGAIYPFWESLSLSGSGGIRTQSLGTAPDRRFVIEWRNVLIDNTANRVDFEVVLFENGDMLFQYRNIDAASVLEQGGSATIGIENQTGTVALQYAFNEAVLTDATAILFQAGGGTPPPPTPTPTATPTPTPTATPTPTPTATPAGFITVSAPNGGEIWPVGSTQTILWSSQGVTGNVRIQISRNGGASFKQIANNVPNTGSFQWTVTKPATIQALIRVVSIDQPSVQDTSDSVFTITQ